jgi:hypothetical protein
MEGEDSRVNFRQRGFIRRAGVKSKEYTALPALTESGAREGVNKQSGYFSLQTVSGIEVEHLGSAVSVSRWFLDGSVEAESLVGRAKVSRQRADMHRDVRLDVSCIRCISG